MQVAVTYVTENIKKVDSFYKVYYILLHVKVYFNVYLELPSGPYIPKYVIQGTNAELHRRTYIYISSAQCTAAVTISLWKQFR
jgi:hypothetical protein